MAQLQKENAEAVLLIRKNPESVLAVVYELLVSSDPHTERHTAGATHPVMAILNTIARESVQNNVPTLFARLSETKHGQHVLEKLSGEITKVMAEVKATIKTMPKKEARRFINQYTHLRELQGTVGRAISLQHCYTRDIADAPVISKWGSGILSNELEFDFCQGRRPLYAKLIEKKKGDDESDDGLLLRELLSSLRVEDLTEAEADETQLAVAEAMFLVYYVYGTLNDRRSAPVLKLFRDLAKINSTVEVISALPDDPKSAEHPVNQKRLLELAAAVRSSQEAVASMCESAPVFKYVIDFVNSHAVRFDGRVRARHEEALIQKWPFLHRNVGTLPFADICAAYNDVIPASWVYGAAEVENDRADAAQAMVALGSDDDASSSSSAAPDEKSCMLAMGRAMRKTAIQFLRDSGLEKTPTKKKRDREGPYKLGYTKGYKDGSESDDLPGLQLEDGDLQAIMDIEQEQEQEAEGPPAKKPRVVGPPKGKNLAHVTRVMREEREALSSEQVNDSDSGSSTSGESDDESDDDDDAKLSSAGESEDDD